MAAHYCWKDAEFKQVTSKLPTDVRVGACGRSTSVLALIPNYAYTTLVSFIFLQIGTPNQILSFVPTWTKAFFFHLVATPHTGTLRCIQIFLKAAFRGRPKHTLKNKKYSAFKGETFYLVWAWSSNTVILSEADYKTEIKIWTAICILV